MSATKTLVVVLNYRTPEFTVRCLEALAREIAERTDVAVEVVDNDSQDGSAERIPEEIERRGWGGWATFRALSSNGGYAAGNNAAIRAATTRADVPELVLVLNPDTAPEPGAIEGLEAVMAAYDDTGIVASKLIDPDGTHQTSAFRYPSAIGELEAAARVGVVSTLLSRWRVGRPMPAAAAETVDWVTGASMMLRTRMLEDVGLLDEGYFLYFEELDLCRRATRAGWTCRVAPSSRVVHRSGQSTGVSRVDKPPIRRPAYWFESRRRYLLKHHGFLGAALVDLAWCAGHVLGRVRDVLLRRSSTWPPHMLGDFLRHSVWVRGATLPDARSRPDAGSADVLSDRTSRSPNDDALRQESP